MKKKFKEGEGGELVYIRKIVGKEKNNKKKYNKKSREIIQESKTRKFRQNDETHCSRFVIGDLRAFFGRRDRRHCQNKGNASKNSSKLKKEIFKIL